jgi:hypothetical protein
LGDEVYRAEGAADGGAGTGRAAPSEGEACGVTGALNSLGRFELNQT